MKYAKLLYGWIGLALIGACFSPPVSAQEVYSWTDENGVRHFSSLPPLSGQEATVQNIVTDEPASSDDSYSADYADSQDSFARDEFEPQAGGEESALSAADQRRLELAERRSERRAAQAELDQACSEATRRLAQIEPSRRVFYTNEEGETVRMDDEERVGEIDTLRQFLSRNCD